MGMAQGCRGNLFVQFFAQKTGQMTFFSVEIFL
jgi:hypothetical protein